MSFSSDVKEELCKQENKRRHCQIAEISAILALSGRIRPGQGRPPILIVRTENIYLAKRTYTLLKQAFKITAPVENRKSGEGGKVHIYELEVSDEDDVKRVMMALHWLEEDDVLRIPAGIANPMIIQNECCKRAFLRGVYLCVGSMSDPEKSYHFEMVCDTIEQAEQVSETIRDFSIDARIVERKGRCVVYIKEGSEIIDLLNLMGAHVSLMNMENVRILKDMRNQVNRRVNCETANLNKTVNAAVKQIEDIQLLAGLGLLESLSPALQEMAELRLDHPDASLKELGELTDPPIGRSGVNHRLKKLGSIADSHR